MQQLEALALTVRRSGEDRKWRELANLLAEIFTSTAIANHFAEPVHASPTQKLVVFTEHRDTLNYLEQRVTTLLGRKEAVACVHGGMGREERMKVQEAFRHDPEARCCSLPMRPAKASTFSARI